MRPGAEQRAAGRVILGDEDLLVDEPQVAGVDGEPLPTGAVCALTTDGTKRGPPMLDMSIAIVVTIAQCFWARTRRNVNGFMLFMIRSRHVPRVCRAVSAVAHAVLLHLKSPPRTGDLSERRRGPASAGRSDTTAGTRMPGRQLSMPFPDSSASPKGTWWRSRRYLRNKKISRRRDGLLSAVQRIRGRINGDFRAETVARASGGCYASAHVSCARDIVPVQTRGAIR